MDFKVDNILDEEFVINNELISLRHYQRNAIGKLLEKYNEGENGYALHCSASGNSISSYALAKCFERLPDVDKVILITSKRDILFRESGLLSVPTKKFLNRISSEKLVMVSSSIFNYSLKYEAKKIGKFSNLNCVFIIDDCMLTTQTDNMAPLRRMFRNYRLYGFLTMPDFKKKLGHFRKINHYFNNKVSEYSLDDAMNDGFLSKTDLEFVGDDNLDNLDLSIGFLSSQQRIEKIGKWIISNHLTKTKNSKYSAILFAPSTSSVLRYYDILKEKTDLKIAVLSKGHDEFKLEERHRIKSQLKEIQKDFNEMFDMGSRTYSKKGFKQIVMDKFNNGEIDLLITNVNDRKINNNHVNTLYWDYNMVSPRLYPFSLVDRKFDEEKEGNVVVFTDLNDDIKIKLEDDKVKRDEITGRFRYNLDNLDHIESFSGKCGIYLLIHNDEVFYVGQSGNLRNRLKDHWHADINEILDSIKKDDGKYNLTKHLAMYLFIEDNLEDIEFEVIECHKSELNFLEQETIKQHAPRYNIQGVSKPFFSQVI
ncbi:MAG: GIY-YIG nuclease family protein [Methanobrevibacter sp.]|uniref:type I restriction enzyme subunit R domain-containing protein n=1 Tax=Methanobrevibacter sp. TaxID=66852 RepID=UPI0026DF6D80|nr:GIY-YIG nuclease family protein [Methanobrevibacter sp.]MDO5848846.1 GIY-YIG nuclease family protein [Methanobrevibacter sp.]